MKKSNPIQRVVDEYKARISPISQYGLPFDEPPEGIKRCGNCRKREKEEKYKVCLRCKQIKIPKYLTIYRRYCSKECQTEHWKVHRLEHTEYEYHFGAFLDNSRLERYRETGAEVRRLGLQFFRECVYNRTDVLKILLPFVDKANLLSLDSPEHLVWIVYMKDVPDADRLIRFGVKHIAPGLKMTTFARPFGEDEAISFETDYYADGILHSRRAFSQEEDPDDDVAVPGKTIGLKFRWPPNLDEGALTREIALKLRCSLKDFVKIGTAWVVSLPETRRAKRVMNDGFTFIYGGVRYHVIPSLTTMEAGGPRAKVDLMECMN